MQAANWGMDHFSTYLSRRKFTLITDHRPIQKLGKVHTKMLHRLQKVMKTYDFDIIYKKGSEMPADYLSCNLINAISWDALTLQLAQSADPLLLALKNFLLNKGTASRRQMPVFYKTFLGAASNGNLSLAKR
jgi:hypothetical protein